nr:zf-CCHC domain-containing protein/UBN2 domain-containing protein [Tanacetum cinerariifolium]
MGDKDLSTIIKKESDKVIKSSVEDLVLIPKGKSVTFSNPLFDSNDDFTSSDDESLSDEDVLEHIESKASYDSNLDEPDLLVTPLFDSNEDECFNPGGGVDEINAFDIPLDFKDGYYGSKEDVLYLESLLSDVTTPNLPPEVFLGHGPEKFKIALDYEDSRARGFVQQIPYGESKVHIEVLSVLWGNRLPIPNGLLPLSRPLAHGRLAYRCDSRLKGGCNNNNNKPETDKSLLTMVGSHTDATVFKKVEDFLVEIRLLDHGRLAYRCDSFQKGRGFPGRNTTPGPWSARIPMWQLFKGPGGGGGCYIYGALLRSRMTNQHIQDFTAYKTYLAYAIGEASPKMKCKFMKHASLLKKRTLVTIEKRKTNIHQAGGSSEGVDFKSEVPDKPKGKSIDINEGTGLKLGVPSYKGESFESEYESLGDSGDEANVQDNEDVQDSDDEPQHANDEKTYFENQETNDGKKETKDEFVHTFQYYVPTDDEMNVESNDVDEKEYDRIDKELYGDVNIRLKDSEREVVTKVISMMDINVQHEDVKELKVVDNSLKVISTIKSKVPNAIKEYLGSNLDYALHKVIQRNFEDIIKEHSVPAKNVKRLRKLLFFKTITKSKSFNKSPNQRVLYHALMESILEDEDVMDEEVADKLKKRKPDDAEIHEGPSARSDRGLKRRKTSKDTKKSKKAKKDMGNTDGPPVVNVDPKDWFKKPKDILLQILSGIKIAKVTTIEESKDLSSLALDALIGNLKVHELVMEKDYEIYKGKKERIKSIAMKDKKDSSDDETSTSKSDDEEYAMAIRNFKMFFRRNGKFVRQSREEMKSFRQRDEKKGKSDRKYFRCGDANHLNGDFPKPSRNKDQKAFIRGSYRDSENDAEDKTNDETCLMAQL